MNKRPMSENLLITFLAVINFALVVDFVVLMPLGPQLMRQFSISTQEFSILVSCYMFTGAITGALASLFIDRFDRRSAMLFCFFGFLIGTLGCALAPHYLFLLISRSVAGGFAGLTGALLFAILGDAIPMERRGTATGRLGAAFPLASILGVPMGLWIANLWGWHWTFGMIVVVGCGIWMLGALKLPAQRRHLLNSDGSAAIRPRAFQQIAHVFKDQNHLWAYALNCTLVFAGFSIIPMISPYLVQNAGFEEKNLPLIYLCGGIATFFTSQLIGAWSDRSGKHRVFAIMVMFSMPALIVMTHLPVVPMWGALVATTYFMVTMAGRFVPALAIVTSSTEPHMRGSFMTINTSLQNLSQGLASLACGALTSVSATGTIVGYETVGWMAVFFNGLALVLSRKVKLRT